MSLRILAQGIAAPIYGQVFSFGVSSSIKKMLGVLVPGLPLFLAAQCSISALMVSRAHGNGRWKKAFRLY